MMDQEFNPLSKKYPGWSPYNYVRDNPMLLIDALDQVPESFPRPMALQKKVLRSTSKTVTVIVAGTTMITLAKKFLAFANCGIYFHKNHSVRFEVR